MPRPVIRRAASIAVATCAWAITTHAAAQGGNPPPQDATAAILAAFDRYDVVGMTAAHGNEKQDDFILTLVRDSRVASKVNDIVVECGNSKHQALADRYVAGEAVSLQDVRQVWRDTSVSMCALSGFNGELFPAVRALNQRLPADRRVRVLLGEPPVDWNTVDPSTARASASNRDPFITAVMTTEVLAKHRKALVLVGVGHLYHDDGRGTAVTALEKVYPGKTYVISTHEGFGAFIDLERGHQLEARMKDWPVPSIVPLKGSWLADLDLPYFLWPFTKRMAGKSITDLSDAYLYLGSGESLTYERTPDAILDDPAYVAEVSRRFGVVSIASLRRRNENRSLYSAADIAEAHQFAPGAECVGAYADKPGAPPAIEIDFRQGVLSARLATSSTWTPLAAGAAPMLYGATTASGTITMEFARAAGQVNGLTMGTGESAARRVLVRTR